MLEIQKQRKHYAAFSAFRNSSLSCKEQWNKKMDLSQRDFA